MAAITANRIIERALTKAGVISPGETVTAAIASQCLEELNGLLESWSLETLMVVFSTIESFTLEIGTGAYTWGVGGTWNTARPIKLLDETFIISDSNYFPIPLLQFDEFTRRIGETNGEPGMVYYNPTYPLGTVVFSPVPTAAYGVSVSSLKKLSEFATLTTSVDLMPGYSRAIISNFAAELCPQFGKKVGSALAAVASMSKKAIQSSNTKQAMQSRTPELAAMTSGGGVYNINTGQFT